LTSFSQPKSVSVLTAATIAADGGVGCVRTPVLVAVLECEADRARAVDLVAFILSEGKDGFRKLWLDCGGNIC
jgi:hypothetical protein